MLLALVKVHASLDETKRAKPLMHATQHQTQQEVDQATMSPQAKLMVWLLLLRELKLLLETKLVVEEVLEKYCVMQQRATADETMAATMIVTCFTADKRLLPAKRSQLPAQDTCSEAAATRQGWHKSQT